MQEFLLIKKETLAQAFFFNFVKLLRTPFLLNTSGRPLLTLAEANTLQDYNLELTQPTFTCSNLTFEIT